PGRVAMPVSPGPIGDAQAACYPPYGAIGTHSVTASYSGGQDTSALFGVRVYSPSSSSVVTANVVRDSPTLSVAAGDCQPTTVIPGETVTFPADVGSVNIPTPLDGTVAFTSGGNTIPGCGAVPVTNDRAWEGFADCTTSFSTVGSPQIVASYSG